MIIYKITNTINNKVYVGQTINSLVYRKNIHKQDWKLGRKSQYKLYQAFTKYGWDAFSWEILEEEPTNINDAEQKWIRYCNSFVFGYNMTTGGDYNPNIGKFGSKHHNSISMMITHPNGTEELVTGIRAWCRQHNLHHQGLSSVAKGKYKQYKGYTARYVTFND